MSLTLHTSQHLLSRFTKKKKMIKRTKEIHFQKTGIYPFNNDIFKEVDILPSVAYRPIVEKEINCQQLQLKQNLNEVENRNESLFKSLNKSFSINIASSSTNSTCSSSTTI